MVTINYVIVEITDTYKNEVEVTEGITFTVNSTIESVENINRVAKVIQSPSFTTLEEGDEVIVHHNIARKRNGNSGDEEVSHFHIEGNKYFVPFSEIFMVKKKGSPDFEVLTPYVFVEAIQKKEEKQGYFTLNSNESNSHKGMEKLVGIMAYPNEELISQGVKVGDKVIFRPYSEYEFNINNKKYYKMSTKDILAISK